MSKLIDELFAQAAQLPDDDRAVLAARLIETLEPATDQDAEGAWAQEIRRRLDEYRAGRTKTLEWDEVRARLQRHAR